MSSCEDWILCYIRTYLDLYLYRSCRDSPDNSPETDEDGERDSSERHEESVVTGLVPVTLQRSARVTHHHVVGKENGCHRNDPQEWHGWHDDGTKLDRREQMPMLEVSGDCVHYYSLM